MAQGGPNNSPDIKLKRFLYIGTEEPHFMTGSIAGNRDYNINRLTCVSDYLKSSNPSTLFNIIEIVNSENLLPRRETLFFVLGVAATSTIPESLKHGLYRTLSTLIKDTKDLFMFVKYYTRQHKKFGSALSRFITTHYNNKTPQELLVDITEANGYYAWSHKDLIKLSHFKWNGLSTAIIIVYILYGMKKAELVAKDDSSVDYIISYLRNLEDLKRAESEKRIAELIPILHCPLNRIPSYYHGSQLIWETILPELPLCDVITHLPRLHKKGFLKIPAFQNSIIEFITNTEKIQESKIHPIEVFVGLREFERGGKPMDPKLKDYLETLEKTEPEKARSFETTIEPVNYPNVTNALHKTMQISFKNPQVWGRKVLITIDISKKMNLPCLNNKSLSCLEAATILTLSILKTERDVTVAIFNDGKINIINMEKHVTFNQALSKIQQGQAHVHYCVPSAPIDWAMNKKKPVDVFINILFYHHWPKKLPQELRDNEQPLVRLTMYRQKMSLPHAKLVSFSLGSPILQIADGSPNVLDICGMDKNVPTVLEAFSKGLF